MAEQKLVYVNKLGKNSEDDYIYEFYFTDDPEIFWITDADTKPASICNLGVPEKSVYDSIKILKTKIKFDLAKDSSCHSYLDCKDLIISLCYECIDSYDEYPPEGRIVFAFASDISEIEITLAKRNLAFESTDSKEFNF